MIANNYCNMALVQPSAFSMFIAVALYHIGLIFMLASAHEGYTRMFRARARIS